MPTCPGGTGHNITSIKKVCTLLNTVLVGKLISKLESFKTLKCNL